MGFFEILKGIQGDAQGASRRCLRGTLGDAPGDTSRCLLGFSEMLSGILRDA